MSPSSPSQGSTRHFPLVEVKGKLYIAQETLGTANKQMLETTGLFIVGCACAVSILQPVETGCKEGGSYPSTQMSRLPKCRYMAEWILDTFLEKPV